MAFRPKKPHVTKDVALKRVSGVSKKVEERYWECFDQISVGGDILVVLNMF